MKLTRCALAVMAACSFPLAQADMILAPVTVTGQLVEDQPATDEITAYSPLQSPKADAGEALRLVPGVSGSRMGQHGVDPIIRGQMADQINVLLDGGYIFGGCPNRMDPPTSFGSLYRYDRVVVEKGVQSLLHGAGGSGGTILFERDTAERAAEAGSSGRLSTGANSNGLKNETAADVLISNGQGYLRAQGEYANADNYKDGDGNRVPSSMNKAAGTLIGGYRFDAHSGIEGTIERARVTDARYAGSGMDAPEDDLTAWRLKGWAGELGGPVDGVRAEIWHSKVDHVMDNYSLREPANPNMLSRSPTTAKTTGGRVVLTSRLENMVIDYGLDANRIDRNAVVDNPATGELRFRTWPEVRQDNIGLFGQADMTIGDAGLLRAGLRVDRHSARIDGNLPGMSIANNMVPWVPEATRKAARKTQRDTDVSGLLRYEHALDGGLTAFAGLSRTIRHPDATERYFFQPGQQRIGNPALNPEKHHQIDVGLIGEQARYRYEAVLFHDWVSDYILRDSMGAYSSYRNVAARLWGFELAGQYALLDTLTLDGSLAYVRGRNTDDSRNLAQMPPLNGQLTLDYRPGPWHAGARTRFAAKQSHIDTASGLDTIKTPAWAVLDLYGGYQLHPQAELRVGVDNLFDRDYAEHVNRAYSGMFGDPTDRIFEPGRTFWARLDVRF